MVCFSSLQHQFFIYKTTNCAYLCHQAGSRVVLLRFQHGSVLAQNGIFPLDFSDCSEIQIMHTICGTMLILRRILSRPVAPQEACRKEGKKEKSWPRTISFSLHYYLPSCGEQPLHKCVHCTDKFCHIHTTTVLSQENAGKLSNNRA